MELRDKLMNVLEELIDERAKQIMEGKKPNSKDTRFKLSQALNDILNLQNDEYQDY
jgi:hypothetical protein